MSERSMDTLRIAEALERIAEVLGSPTIAPFELEAADAFVFDAGRMMLRPVPHVSRVPLELIRGVDQNRDRLLENTERFARGLPANNVLLWGARGMGKSSLVKAVHATVSAHTPLKLVEINRDDIGTLPELLNVLRDCDARFVLFCDDLSFDHDDGAYKSLKAVLEGGIDGRPANVVFYATSNRRHLLPRDMMENERATAINPSEAIEEKVSLSDRFGLWLGFHKCTQDDYLAMIRGYADHFGLPIEADDLDRRALQWAAGRGARSGRVAHQFIQDLRGSIGEGSWSDRPA